MSIVTGLFLMVPIFKIVGYRAFAGGGFGPPQGPLFPSQGN